ncbi:hypothetical protein KO504_14195 [Winogradskyella psychrotolerans]|uniref:hypothetical protein n=1 Tax=Winogradskyella psychrotolerans TaxID=1344585 RepID=UPI001C06DF04|nr:hypothetical protein [Winogradskyella psychrotolerans]MBU2922495.1 hypothetical protein [Winogradskyella psychrotolerans]
MINKEQKYRKELFELLKSNIEIGNEHERTLELIQEVFITDSKDINIEEILDKLTRDE